MTVILLSDPIKSERRSIYCLPGKVFGDNVPSKWESYDFVLGIFYIKESL